MSANYMVFIDTNIFVYAHDETDRVKSKKARALLIKLTDNNEGKISTQVIHEFCNVMLRKAVMPLRTEDVKTIVEELMSPLLAHRSDAQFILRALKTYDRYSVGFYDALIIQAAIDLDCSIIYSEDLQASMHFGKVQVVNPFM